MVIDQFLNQILKKAKKKKIKNNVIINNLRCQYGLSQLKLGFKKSLHGQIEFL